MLPQVRLPSKLTDLNGAISFALCEGHLTANFIRNRQHNFCVYCLARFSPQMGGNAYSAKPFHWGGGAMTNAMLDRLSIHTGSVHRASAQVRIVTGRRMMSGMLHCIPLACATADRYSRASPCNSFRVMGSSAMPSDDIKDVIYALYVLETMCPQAHGQTGNTIRLSMF